LGVCDGQSGLLEPSLETAAAKVVDVAATFPQYVEKLPMEVNSLFQAAVVLRQMAIMKDVRGEEDGAEEKEESRKVLEMLKMFERRWKVSGLYLRKFKGD